jgi:hypothetical protein
MGAAGLNMLTDPIPRFTLNCVWSISPCCSESKSRAVLTPNPTHPPEGVRRHPGLRAQAADRQNEVTPAMHTPRPRRPSAMSLRKMVAPVSINTLAPHTGAEFHSRRHMCATVGKCREIYQQNFLLRFRLAWRSSNRECLTHRPSTFAPP